MNVCRDFLRKKKFRVFVSFWSDSDEEQSVVETLESKDKNARESLQSKDLGNLIGEAMQKLPLRQKSVFSLRYLDSMSLEEIAQSTGLTVGAVKAHLWQACHKMRKYLEAPSGKEVFDV
jgi:RNA polymerase sigma-70 factor (ECF subfamily)